MKIVLFQIIILLILAVIMFPVYLMGFIWQSCKESFSAGRRHRLQLIKGLGK